MSVVSLIFLISHRADKNGQQIFIFIFIYEKELGKCWELVVQIHYLKKKSSSQRHLKQRMFLLFQSLPAIFSV